MVTCNGRLWRGLYGALVVVTLDYDYDYVEADVCIQSIYKIFSFFINSDILLY